MKPVICQTINFCYLISIQKDEMIKNSLFLYSIIKCIIIIKKKLFNTKYVELKPNATLNYVMVYVIFKTKFRENPLHLLKRKWCPPTPKQCIHYLPFKEDLDVLPKPWRVVVPDGLSVAKRLKQRVGLQDLLGDEVVAGAVHGGQVLHDQLGRLGLTRAALTARGNNKQTHHIDLIRSEKT